MEDDYNGSVGISWPLWAYAIICIFVNIHGLNIYFWISFAPAILVLLVGTELQHVIAQLALEVVGATAPYVGTQLKLRDDLFWFGKPRVLWWLIQFISFQVIFFCFTPYVIFFLKTLHMLYYDVCMNIIFILTLLLLSECF
jgi:mlo protein